MFLRTIVTFLQQASLIEDATFRPSD
jgi:hypothetical protein